MTFNGSSGTRGGRHPQSGGLSTWFNNRAVNRIRRRGGSFMGMKLLVLNTVGKKSGAARSNPVAWFPGDDGSWLVVASAGGSSRNPAWYYNLAGNPDRVSIDVDRGNVPVVAEQLQGADRDRAWQAITTASPRFADYESKTDRLIPIIKLSRR
ncbi:MAG TPA: nitroreductase/quinone reductase family protein [Galbitalea sp.]|jgi:deazaflavin-dependent oxidoreductase (nitroreductase family)|nr:nitroreductase/quinone reductase family protein [Galbitalea sp.]